MPISERRCSQGNGNNPPLRAITEAFISPFLMKNRVNKMLTVFGSMDDFWGLRGEYDHRRSEQKGIKFRGIDGRFTVWCI